MNRAIDRAVRPFWPAVCRWLTSVPALRLGTALVVATAGIASFTLYESLALGWPLGREETALFDAYHLLRTVFDAGAAALLAIMVTMARARGCGLDRSPLGPASTLGAVLVMAVALAAAGILALNPAVFHAFALEDTPLEWASALLLLGASGMFTLKLAREPAVRSSVAALGLAGLLAAAFFVLGMEEISWLQRILGFGTPAPLAEVNWQAEFNVHNIQTDLSELIFYTGAGLFLSALPLVRDALAPALARHRLAAFVPDRGVAAVAAPAAIFTFGQWNQLPVQLASWLTLAVLIVFAYAARRRGHGREGVLFAALAAAVAAGQALVLADGALMIDLPDASEYKEFFIAFGFAWYAAGVLRAEADAASA